MEAFHSQVIGQQNGAFVNNLWCHSYLENIYISIVGEGQLLKLGLQ